MVRYAIKKWCLHLHYPLFPILAVPCEVLFDPLSRGPSSKGTCSWSEDVSLLPFKIGIGFGIDRLTAHSARPGYSLSLRSWVAGSTIHLAGLNRSRLGASVSLALKQPHLVWPSYSRPRRDRNGSEINRPLKITHFINARDVGMPFPIGISIWTLASTRSSRLNVSSLIATRENKLDTTSFQEVESQQWTGRPLIPIHCLQGKGGAIRPPLQKLNCSTAHMHELLRQSSARKIQSMLDRLKEGQKSTRCVWSRIGLSEDSSSEKRSSGMGSQLVARRRALGLGSSST